MNESELEQLVSEHGASLVLFARQWCDCPDDALQEALIELVTQDTPPKCPKAWLFRVVRNKAMNIARSECRRAKHESVAANDDPWFAPISSSSVDAEFARAWIQTLPEIQRQIVTARIWGDLTFDQVAEIVERPTTTVFRLFREAIETLRLEMNISEQKRPLQSLNEGPIHE